MKPPTRSPSSFWGVLPLFRQPWMSAAVWSENSTTQLNCNKMLDLKTVGTGGYWFTYCKKRPGFLPYICIYFSIHNYMGLLLWNNVKNEIFAIWIFFAITRCKKWWYWPYQRVGYCRTMWTRELWYLYIYIHIFIFCYYYTYIYICIYISYISMYPHLFSDIVHRFDKPDGSWMNEDIRSHTGGTWFSTSRCTCNSATGWGSSEMGWDDGPVHLTHLRNRWSGSVHLMGSWATSGGTDQGSARWAPVGRSFNM